MVDIAKENLCINKLISEKTEIIFVEGDIIIPDSKPDVLNTISTSGIACIYKKEVQEGKIRFDGSVQTYIMYVPEGKEEGIRGLSTTLDFSESIEMEGITSEMQATLTTSVKSVEAKVINDRKIGIKVALEVSAKVYSKDEKEVVNDVTNDEEMQILKTSLTVNSLLGTGTTKINAKDTVQIDSIDQLAEILKVSVNITNKDIKISYNKVLTKAEAEIKIMYLTEDNRINHINPKIAIVGFIDIPDVSENNTCEVNYELRNIIIKPQPQEEHSIYVELEYEVSCNVYEEKDMNLIQDMYRPDINLKIERTKIATMSDKKVIKQTKTVQEKINLNDIEGKNLIDVESSVQIQKETKINTKILYEMELKMKFMFLSQTMQVTTQTATIPFEYVIDNLERGESLNTRNEIEILSQDFVIQDGGNISCNINVNIETNMYRNNNTNLINSVEENGEREEEDYSIIIYIVKKGDTLWNIAKEFGSTVDDIVKANAIENPDVIQIGEKLYIPKFVRMPSNRYA